MFTYVFKVQHPDLEPSEGVVEVEADSAAEAILLLARRMPGIHIVELVMSYDNSRVGHA